MNQTITTELEFFLISILWGAIILAAYDILRIIRRLIKHNTFILAAEDILFWVVASVFIFAMIYNQNDGIIRGFSVMGVTIGMVLYHYILSSFLVNTITNLIKMLLSPFAMAIKMVKRFLHYVLMKAKKIVNFFARRLKKRMDSYKIKVDAKKQAMAAKKAIKSEKKAMEKKKKKDQKLAKRNANTGTSQQDEQPEQPVYMSKANQSMQPILGNKAQQRLLREKKLEAERSLGHKAFESSERIPDSVTSNLEKDNLTPVSSKKKIHRRKAENNKKETKALKPAKK